MYMAELISKCDGEKVVLEVHFSENASITSKYKVQSAHWSRICNFFHSSLLGQQMVRVRV